MKSLELNWIRSVDKSLVIPEVMFYPFGEDEKGGCYYDPEDNEIYDDKGKSYSMKYGVIVVSSDKDNETMESIIAHEWRHHYQYYHGIKHDRPKYDLLFEDYNKAVKQYFTTSKSELDAMRFSYKYAKQGKYQGWEEILYELIKDLRPKKTITYGYNTLIHKH